MTKIKDLDEAAYTSDKSTGGRSLNVNLDGSDIELGAAELKDATTDTRATIKTDNTAGGTATALVVGGQYNLAQSTYGDGDVVVGQYDVNGNLKVTGGASSVQAKYISPTDFTAAFTSSSTITLTGLPITISNAAQIVYVKQTTAANAANTYVAGSAGISFGYSAGVITIYKNGSANAVLVTGDVYEVGVNAQDKAYDATTELNKVGEQSPLDAHYVQDSLVDTTNVAAATGYWPSATGMAMMGKDLSFTIKLIEGDAVTDSFTLEATNDEDTTNADWIPVVGQLSGLDNGTGGTLPTVTGTGGALAIGSLTTNITSAIAQTVRAAWDFDNFNYSYFRMKYVMADSTNTVIVKMRRKSL